MKVPKLSSLLYPKFGLTSFKINALQNVYFKQDDCGLVSKVSPDLVSLRVRISTQRRVQIDRSFKLREFTL